MKQNLKTIINTTGEILGISLSVFFLTFVVLAWTGPQHTPPTCESGEVGCDAPLHTGATAQSKTGGLLLNTGGATNGLIVENGNVGIGTTSPVSKLHVDGAIQIGTMFACTSAEEGAQRYDFSSKTMEFCNGSSWVTIGGLNSIPAGAVMAFNLEVCPAGWSEYLPARGRFIRGLDNGAGIDPDGTRALESVQLDAFQNITGVLQLKQAEWGGSGVFADGGDGLLTNSTGCAPAGTNVSFDASRMARTSIETRPNNVALLYCSKD